MAAAAGLTVLASGPRELYDDTLPLLQLWGPRQFYLGPAEEARLMKLVINLMVAHTAAMMAEALALGQKGRSEEHTSELQSLMRITYAVFCLKKKKNRI